VSGYPTDEQVRSHGRKYPWRQVAADARLETYSEINRGLLSAILALKEEYRDDRACAAIGKVLETAGNIWMPPEGCFPILLHEDILSAFEAKHSDEVVFLPEFPDLDPVQHLKLADLRSTQKSLPYRGTLLPADGIFLFTVDWDSFFTLLYGPFAFVSDVVKQRQLEGFFLGESTRHAWWTEPVPIPASTS
jgi:hypothetical protein